MFVLITILFYVLTTTFCIAYGNDTDSVALLAFKSEIIQDSSGILISWNESVHFCEWEGVTCGHSHKRVIKLELKSKGLVGTLSPFVGNLSFLQELQLSNNSFHGHIPHQIGHLRRLQRLRFINNSFEGEIPWNISQCSYLTVIKLGHNKLEGKIPTELGLLSNLKILGLEYNYLTGGLSSIANLTSLQKLYLSGQSFWGYGPGFQAPIPDFIGKFKDLSILALGGSGFIGTIPSSLYNLSSLEVFSVSANRLSGNLPPNLGSCFPQLEWLQIAGNNFTGHIPVSLSNLSNIVLIEIELNHFSGKFSLNGDINLPHLSLLSLTQNNLGTGEADDLDFLDSLSNCSGLDIVSISYNNFGGNLPPSISNLSTTTQFLIFDSNRISGVIPSGLGNLQNLQILTMRDNRLTGTIPSDIGSIPMLQAAYFTNNQLWGKIPPSFGNLSWLSTLDLSSNLLNETIPSTLGHCNSLLALDLSQNNFVGNVPHQLFQASKLYFLSIHNNYLEGTLSSQVGELKNLQLVDMSSNNFSGEIPSSFGQCVEIIELYLENNLLDGSIPSFSLLKSLQLLDLSSNRLSGKIPDYFSGFSSLIYLNLSFNNLDGELPTKGIFSNLSGLSVHGNYKLCGGVEELHLPRCPYAQSRKLSLKLTIIISISCILGSLTIAALFYMIYSRNRKKLPSNSPPLKEPFSKVSYDMLLKATDGFSQRNLIGAGSFGSVYRGKLAQNKEEKDVAIKVFHIQRKGASKSFLAECEALRSIRHRNLVRVVTACSSIDFQGNDFKALVYEFKPKGSLEKWLYPDLEEGDPPVQSVSLLQRVNIAIDVAYAIDYIHNGCDTPLIHCDLKPSNILLDENMIAHVGDFGLAMLLPEISDQLHNSSSVGIRGTLGYAAPEYGLGAAVSAAGDVYSYGIMLIEMITAKRPTDPIFRGDLTLRKFATSDHANHSTEIMDPKLVLDHDNRQHKTSYMNAVHDYTYECVKSVISVGVACSSELPQARMSLEDVIGELESTRKELELSIEHVFRVYNV